MVFKNLYINLHKIEKNSSRIHYGIILLSTHTVGRASKLIYTNNKTLKLNKQTQSSPLCSYLNLLYLFLMNIFDCKIYPTVVIWPYVPNRDLISDDGHLRNIIQTHGVKYFNYLFFHVLLAALNSFSSYYIAIQSQTYMIKYYSQSTIVRRWQFHTTMIMMIRLKAFPQISKYSYANF